MGPWGDIPSSMPVELTWGIEGNDVDSLGTVVTVVTKIDVAAVFMVVVTCSSLEVGGPLFDNGICSSTILGSLIVSSQQLMVYLLQ